MHYERLWRVTEHTILSQDGNVYPVYLGILNTGLPGVGIWIRLSYIYKSDISILRQAIDHIGLC